MHSLPSAPAAAQEKSNTAESSQVIMGRRCGHNYLPTQCPYAECAIRDGLREIIAQVESVVDLGTRLNDPAAIALAMGLKLVKIQAMAQRILRGYNL